MKNMIALVPILLQVEVYIEDGIALMRFSVLASANIIRLLTESFKHVTKYLWASLN